jgi:hypothetical protein
MITIDTREKPRTFQVGPVLPPDNAGYVNNSDQARAGGADDGFESGRGVELVQQVADMALNGGFR